MTPVGAPWRARVLGLARSRLAHNAIALYAAYVANYFLPLLTAPYLAYTLGPRGWGLVAFAQAFGQYLSLLIEYGFNWSATREVARHKDDAPRLAQLLAGVLGAKLVLGAGCLLLALGAARWVATFREHPALLAGAVVFGLAQAFRPLWVFQGLERMRVAASLDIAAKVLSTLAIFAVVRGAGDAWKVLAVQALAVTITMAVAFVLAYRTVRLRRPTWALTVEALRMGGSIFLLRGSVSLYSIGNTFILGLFAAPQYVGYYAAADKLSRAFMALMDPLMQALFPRLSMLAQQARDDAAALVRRTMLALSGAGTLTAVGLFVAAPVLVPRLLGAEFAPAATTLRVLVALFPLLGLSNPLATQWMLPLGMDRLVTTTTALGGLVNIMLALLLARAYGDIGMAAAVVTTELFVTCALVGALQLRRLNPLSGALVAQAP